MWDVEWKQKKIVYLIKGKIAGFSLKEFNYVVLQLKLIWCSSSVYAHSVLSGFYCSLNSSRWRTNMSDEEAYMSDTFLAKCLPEDVRPGLKRVGIYVFI